MLSTSSFLPIALLAAIGSATVPAAANALTVFGGGSSHLAQLPSTAPALSKPQASQEASHILGKAGGIPTVPAAPGQSSVGTGKVMIPVPKGPTGITSVQNAQDSCANNPKLCGPIAPPPPPCKPDKCNPPPPPHQKDDDNDHHRPVVIFVPQVPVQVPAGVSGVIPPSAPARVATGGGSGSAAAAQAQPVV